MTTKTESEMTYYDSVYEYVQNADISHYSMSGDGEEEYCIVEFSPADDLEFMIDIDSDPIEHDGKTYLRVCWGEAEDSALLESAFDEMCYILYRWDEYKQEYTSDGTVYETAEAAKRVKIVENLSDSQYYCLRCEQIFEYEYPEQYGCEQCNAAIDDDNIAG